MQPHDDALPEELDPDNAAMIALVSRAFGRQTGPLPFEQVQKQAVANVFERLQRFEQLDMAGLRLASRSPEAGYPSQKERKQPLQPAFRSRRQTGSARLAQIAAVMFMVLLVGSLLLVLHLAQSVRTGARPDLTTRTGGLPVSPPGIYTSRSDGVYRYNLQTRKVIWHTHVAGQSLYAGDPVLIGDTLYIVTDSWVSARDAQTGTLRWSHDFQGRVTDPYMDKGVLYFSTIPPLPAALYAVNPANGTITATYTPIQGQAAPIVANTLHPHQYREVVMPQQGSWAGPIVANGLLYYVASSTLYAVQLPSEKLIWQQQISTPVLLIAPKGINVQNGIVYVQIFQNPPNYGLIEAFDAHTGAKLWLSPAGLRTVTVTTEMIYAASVGGELLAFNSHTHALVWQKSFNTYDIRAVSGVLYIAYGSPDGGQVAALDAATGNLIWQQSKSNGLSLDSVVNGVVYGESWSNDGKDGTIYAFNASNGTQIWTMPTGVPNVQWGGIVVA